MRSAGLRQPAFALGPSALELPDRKGLLEAALPWISGLCFITAILLASWDGARCEPSGDAGRSQAAATLAPILSSGRRAEAESRCPERPSAPPQLRLTRRHG